MKYFSALCVRSCRVSQGSSARQMIFLFMVLTKKSTTNVSGLPCTASKKLALHSTTKYMHKVPRPHHWWNWDTNRPQKITTITQFPEPTDIPKLQRFLGMATHLGKFILHLVGMSGPLRHLLKYSIWPRESHKKTAFNLIKYALVSPGVLTHYNPKYPTIVSADASNQGISAAMLQVKKDGKRHPICYASRSLTDAEKR